MRALTAIAVSLFALLLAVPYLAIAGDDSPCAANCRMAADSCCQGIIQLCPRVEPCGCVCPPLHRCAETCYPDDCLPCVNAPCHKPVVPCTPDAPCICLPKACHLPVTPCMPPAPCLCVPAPEDCAGEVDPS